MRRYEPCYSASRCVSPTHSNQVRRDLAEALQMPIGKTVARIDEIIGDLARFQKEAEAAKAKHK